MRMMALTKMTLLLKKRYPVQENVRKVVQKVQRAIVRNCQRETGWMRMAMRKVKDNGEVEMEVGVEVVEGEKGWTDKIGGEGGRGEEEGKREMMTMTMTTIKRSLRSRRVMMRSMERMK